jgi:hypothetical protein
MPESSSRTGSKRAPEGAGNEAYNQNGGSRKDVFPGAAESQFKIGNWLCLRAHFCPAPRLWSRHPAEQRAGNPCGRRSRFALSHGARRRKGFRRGSGSVFPDAASTTAFDVVYHVGRINFFNGKAGAIREMIRKAKPGTRS